jgi:uncharacterized protein
MTGPRPSSDGPACPTVHAIWALRPLRVDQMQLDPVGLLGSWQNRNASATLPHCIDRLDASGALDNIRRAAGELDGVHVGMWFSDSDVYKTLEAAAWQLARDPDDAGLRDFVEQTTALLARAQDVDGYLNSYFQHKHPERRWREMHWSHELYCAGHLIQAAVAAARADVAPDLLAVARRFADLLVTRFGPGGTDAVCGHPEIETALVELYRQTGHQPYLELAARFVDLRGKGLLGEGAFGRAYFQDHVSVRDAAEVAGHAVRQLYLLAGVVDVGAEGGDITLLSAAERLWDSAFRSRTYLTGAHGSRHRDEAFGDPYELPPDRAYAETCAAIASFQWNWRMLLATGEHRYADEMERVLYNAIAVSTAVDGRHFFYSNPLQLRAGHDGSNEDAPSQRLPWYSCACCPPNVARLVASLQAYVATVDDEGVQLHLYAAGTIQSGFGVIDVATDYPWQGRVSVTVEPARPGPWTLALRMPAWCTDATVEMDGRAAPAAAVDGYLRVRREWAPGTRIVLDLSMPAQLVEAHPRVDAVRGCVALRRGPVVYGLEQADLPGHADLEDVRLDPDAPVTVTAHGAGALAPVTLTAGGRLYPDEVVALHRPHRPGGAVTSTPLALIAIPYFLWCNRTPGPMRVWIPVCPTG